MSRSRSIAGIIFTTAIVLIVLLVASQFFLAWRSNTRLSTKLAELKAAGDPTSIADLRPGPLPPDENAAVQLAKIGNDLEAFSNEYFGKFENTETGKAWMLAIDQGKLPTTEQAAAARAVLAKYPTILLALRRAAACRDYASLYDFTRSPLIAPVFLNEGQQLRALARFVRAEMAALVVEEKPDEAVQVGIDLLRVTRHCDNEPFLVAYLVAVAVRGMAVDSINNALQRGEIDAKISAALENELSQHDPLAEFGKALREERVYGVAALDEQIGGVVNAVHWPKLNWQVGVVDYYSAAIPLGKLQWFEGKSTLNQAKLKADDAGPFAEQILTGIESSYQAANRITAQLRCLRILNALQSYAKQQGKPATGLAVLPLAQPDTIDPFTGQPLLLNRTDKGWIIYSVMVNGIDDGGDFNSLKDYGIGPPGHEYDAKKSDADQ